MTRPSEPELRALYDKHSGNIVNVAKELKRAPATVNHWYHDIGMSGAGKGGQQSTALPKDELMQLWQRFDGNINRISDSIGQLPSTVAGWYRKIGLRGKGREPSRVYPKELRTVLQNGTAVFWSDAHWISKDKTPAHEALLKVIRDLKPQVLIANGDLLDGQRISRHDPSGLQETLTLADELQIVKEHMAELARAAPKAERYYSIGNHDARFSKYVAVNASDLEGLEGSRLDHHILGWQFCWSVRINDDVVVTHRIKGGQHAAWTSLLRAGTNVFFGHLHSQKVYPFTDYRGTRWGVDIGCLADPESSAFSYTEASPLDWRSGFCIATFKNGRLLPPQLVTVLDDGSVYMQRNERVA